MVTVKIIETGTGTCALTAREGDGLAVAFDNDTPVYLSWRSFKQLLSLRLAQQGKAPAVTVASKPVASSPEMK